jgi:predicted RNA-binding Zn ribbon-like protein
VQQFLNSAEYTGGEVEEEDLTDVTALRKWFRTRGLIGPRAEVGEADLARAIDVREGLRDLLGANAGREVPADSLARLEQASSRCGLRTTFTPGEPPRLEADCSDVDGGLARLLAIVATAAADGTWQRLRTCADDGCRWAFYDRSKNRSGRWCSMETCGNRHKARAARARTSGHSADAPKNRSARKARS